MTKHIVFLLILCTLLCSLGGCFQTGSEQQTQDYDKPDFPYAIHTAPVDQMQNDPMAELFALPLQGQITGDRLRIRTSPGEGEVIGHLNTGDRIAISMITHLDEVMWCYNGDGWISMDYVTLPDFNIHGGFPALFPYGTSTRIDPNQTGRGDGSLGPGTYVNIWQLYSADTVLWGRCDYGWVNMSECALPNGLRLMIGQYTQALAPTVPTAPPTTAPSGSNELMPAGTPNSTKLVGQWQAFSLEDFWRHGSFHPVSWSFYADGTFCVSSCEYAYFEELGGFGGASGSGEEYGLYTYDNKTLKLHYYYYSDPGGIIYGERTETYSGRINGNVVDFGDIYLWKDQDFNALIRQSIRENPGKGGSAMVGSWKNDNGQFMTFHDDGTFSVNFSNGEGIGVYACINDQLFLVYSNRNGSTKDYLYWSTYTLSGDHLSLQNWFTNPGASQDFYRDSTDTQAFSIDGTEF